MRNVWIITASTAAAALALTACGGDSSTSDGGEVVLDFPSWQATEPGYQEFWESAIAEFEETHPDVKIELQQVAFDDYQQTLVTRFAANNAPDIVHLPTRFFPSFADQGFLAPLDDDLEGTDILDTWPAGQEQLKWDDQYQGVLLSNYGYVLFYNREMLDEAGVKVPTTWDQLIEAAAKLTTDDRFGIAMDTSQNPNLLQELSWPIVGAGRHYVEDDQYTLTDPEIVTIAEQVRELASYSPQGLASEQKRQYFVDGSAAMMIDGPFVGQLIEDAPAKMKKAIEVAPPPFETVPGALSNSIHLPAAAEGKEREMAWEFIEMLTQPEWQDKYAENLGVPAPREGSGAAAAEQDERFAVYADVVADAVDVVPDHPAVMLDYPTFADAVSSTVSHLVSSDTPADELMAKLQETLEAEIPLTD